MSVPLEKQMEGFAFVSQVGWAVPTTDPPARFEFRSTRINTPGGHSPPYGALAEWPQVAGVHFSNGCGNRDDGMNRLTISIASDFSAEYSEVHGLDIPADGYYDPILEVFGENTSKEDAIVILNKRIPELTAELSAWLDIELGDDSVRNTLYRSLINFYGDTIDE